MAYNTYHTEGLVLKIFPQDESAVAALIFSKKLGLIRATAQGVRKKESKLRASLQEFSFSFFSLVHGKGGWRIINALPQKNYYYLLYASHASVRCVAHVNRLLLRLLAGEEENKKLFSLVVGAFDFIEKENLSEKEVYFFERMTVLRVLHNLGYIEETPVLQTFIFDYPYTTKLIHSMDEHTAIVTTHINSALHASQL